MHYIGIYFPVIDKLEILRWNLRKADWEIYSKFVEKKNLNRIKKTPKNDMKFIQLIKTAASIVIDKDYIPR